MASSQDTLSTVVRMATASNRFPMREEFLRAWHTSAGTEDKPDAVLVDLLTKQSPVLMEQMLGRVNCAYDGCIGEDDISQLYARLDPTAIPCAGAELKQTCLALLDEERVSYRDELQEALSALPTSLSQFLVSATGATRLIWLFMRDEDNWR